MRREALLDLMVGEARVHVQGASLKARAALLTEASQLPDHQDRERASCERFSIFGSSTRWRRR